MAVAHVRRPSDFTLPANPDQLFDAVRSLSNAEQIEFGRELLDAMGSVKSEDDFRPVLVVLERWYRTALLRQHPGWHHALEQADALAAGRNPADVHKLNFDQLRQEVKRRRRSA
jgi:hypothetical protein